MATSLPALAWAVSRPDNRVENYNLSLYVSIFAAYLSEFVFRFVSSV